MNKAISLFFFLLLIFSCTNKTRENIAAKKGAKADTLVPPKVTVLALLPDSLQARTLVLDNSHMPKTVPALRPPVSVSLPVLKNAKGEPIKDEDGRTFIMGDGGISNFSTYTTDNGLALDAVSCAMRDKTGNLWFGTYGGGVSRYDGKSFTTFSVAQGLANNTVWSIAEDKGGNLWFGTNGGGVSRYDGKCFTTLTKAQGLANDVVYSIAEDKTGKLWFGTFGGVSCFDPVTGPGSFKTYTTTQGLANDIVYCIAEDRTGTLWFGTKGGGVSAYNQSSGRDAKAFTTYDTAQGLANNVVWCIAEDKTGNLWFGTWGGGLSRCDRSKSGAVSFTNFSTVHGLANNVVRSIAEDKAGNLWVGTDGGGVSRYDPSASVKGLRPFTTFTTAQGLANNVVYSIVEDKTGNPWFGTNGGGVSRYDGRSFTTFSTSQGLANNIVYTIAEDKTGALWFGTYGGGVSSFDGKSFTNFTTAQGLPDNTVWSIAVDRSGSVWFGTNGGGVSRYNSPASSGCGSFTTFTTAQGLAKNEVYSIAEDNAGNMWFGTNDGGVSRYDGKSFTTYTTSQGLAGNVVSNIYEDKAGILWLGTTGGGVSRYDGRSFTTFTTAQGLGNNTVYNISEDKDGNLWIGTQEGLSVMSRDIAKKLMTVSAGVAGGSAYAKVMSGEKSFFKTFTTTDGLPDNLVTQVFQMPNGKMAAGTNLGIAIFVPSADLTSLTGLEIYNSVTSYPVKDINGGQHGMLLDRKGVIWAGTGSEKTALVRFDPSALPVNNKPPILVIKGIKVNEEHICWYDLQRLKNGVREPAYSKTDSNVTPAYIAEEVTTMGRVLSEKERDSMGKKYRRIKFDGIEKHYPIPEHLVLPYKQNHITIDFNAIETAKPGLVQYQYMLEGYDEDWGPAEKTTSATFGNISSGTYTFKVRAQGPNGVWSEPITYTFRVLPPWYRTWWAYDVYVVLFLIAFRIFFKWQERSLREENERLERKVDERTAVIEKQKEELVQKHIVVEEQKGEVEKQKKRSDELLFNILPREVAEELKDKGKSKAKHFDNVTVMFTDFINFTSASERMTPQELIDELHTCFHAFDDITSKHRIEKIKTIGDAYLAVAGLPLMDAHHAENAVLAAKDICAFMQDRVTKLGDKTFQIRIGIHSGSVVAGIVGVKKFAYDIWGDTVNTAARMEQNCEGGKINISESTYELVKNITTCTYRGEIGAKGKGMLKMYYVN